MDRPPSSNEPSHQEKENGENTDKEGPVINRRESLGRGILKNFARRDANATITVSLPLRDIHHDRLSLDGRAYRRRVSFAPEVTLHKIDLIPQARSPEQRQPRRRETIAFAPHTPRELSPLPSETNSQEFEAEEIMYDSSDAEMEDATDVYLSPTKPGPSFKIHEDEQNFQDEEYSGTIEMNITRHTGDVNSNMTIGEEDTMDLTRPLGLIQLLHPSLSQQPQPEAGPENQPSPTQESIQMSLQTENSSQDSINSQSQRPFGSIRNLFGEEEDQEEEGGQEKEAEAEAEEKDNVDEDEEVDMELTQPISISLQPITANLQAPVAESDTEESGNEESMELTTFADASMDPITIQNTMMNRAIPQTSENETYMDVTMEQTRAFGSIVENNDVNVTMEQTRVFGSIVNNRKMDLTFGDATMEMTMDETRLPTTIQTNLPNTTNILPSRNTTPLKANRSHTSETGSPMSSKRQKIIHPDSTTDLRARINMLTPKKKRRTLSLEQFSQPVPSLVEFEAPSQQPEPVASSQISNELKSSFTPLRSNDGTRKSIINSGKVEFSLTQKVPLAPSHEQEELVVDGQEYQPVSLSQFLSDLSIEFFDGLNINDDFTVEFKTLPQTKTVTPLDYVIARNTKIPWLEFYSFSCDELQKNMKELKGLFDDLDAEFAEENPRLVRDYYESTSFVQQKKMSDALIRMKQYSDYESEKAWSTWREKLFDELQTRLEKNLDTLQEDNTNLSSGKEKILEIERQLDQENAALDQELQRLLQEKESAESSDIETLIDLRAEILSELVALKHEEESIGMLRENVESLAEQVVDTTALENEIVDMELFVKRQSQDPLVRLNSELKTFEILEQASGMRLGSLKGSKISVRLIDSGIKVHFDLLEQCVVSVELPKSLSEMKRVFLEKYIAGNLTLDTSLLIDGLERLSRSLYKFESDLFGIGLLCPITVNVDDGVTLELTQFDRVSKYKALVKMVFDESSMLSGCTPQRIEAQLVYGSKRVTHETILNGLKSKSMSSCFIQNISTLSLTRD